MILGVVSLQGLPTIILPIAGQDWPATIDTGFNGDLELPDVLRDPLNAQFVGRATAALAGGQTVEEDLYLVDFPFDGRVVQAEATFVFPGVVFFSEPACCANILCRSTLSAGPFS